MYLFLRLGYVCILTLTMFYIKRYDHKEDNGVILKKPTWNCNKDRPRQPLKQQEQAQVG